MENILNKMIYRKSDLYDLLCGAITQIEGTMEKQDIEQGLKKLITLQNNWEEVIGVKS